MTVVFFGHRDAPQNIQRKLEETLIHLIEDQKANNFYVGNQGSFDSIVKTTLKKLKQQYSHINYAVVLAYMPGKAEKTDNFDYSVTIFPDGLENTPPKYAIVKRNRWMIDQADVVITYINRNFGGAAKFQELAKKKNKIVINLASLDKN